MVKSTGTLRRLSKFQKMILAGISSIGNGEKDAQLKHKIPKDPTVTHPGLKTQSPTKILT
jgi:hypothetical protein